MYKFRLDAMETPKVWVPDPTSGYKLGKIIDIGADSVSVQLFESNEVRILYLLLLFSYVRLYLNYIDFLLKPCYCILLIILIK